MPHFIGSFPRIFTFLSFTYIRFTHADVKWASITPITHSESSTSTRSLQRSRKKADLGGRQGLAGASNLSKHKNRIKNIGVKFFTEDSTQVFQQDQTWQETYDYDASVGYHWFGKSSIGLGTMNLIIKEYNESNKTVIFG